MTEDRTHDETRAGTTTGRLGVRLLASVVAVLMVAAIGIAPVEAQDRPADPATAETQFLQLLNTERSDRGLAPLTSHSGLRADARNWSSVMAAQGEIFHTTTLAADTAARLPDWRRAGENVGYGPEVERLHDMFVASPAHFDNIVGDFNYLGVGVVYEGSRIYVTFRFAKAPESGAVASSTTPVSYSVASAQVRRLYLAFFEREPETGGHTYWTDRVSAGFALGGIADRFVDSSEFNNTYGHLDNRGFIDLVYRNVMDRSPDAGGYQYWLNRMGGGLSRGDLMVEFSESSEFRRLTA
ncbi:MAG: DUF4214 domain-containing protein [Acidimicrobiales bacterium]|nr:DUF4214 domain-containing protein [Acidimicrobiales bacterium]